MATPRSGRPHGGARANAGRPKGARTKVYKPHREKLLAAKAGGMLPKEVLLDIMRRHYRAKRFDEAAHVAALVANYVHPRLSCSSITVKPSLVEIIAQMTDEELAENVAELNRMFGDEAALVTAQPKGTA